MRDVVLVFDIGGTKTAAALADRDDVILTRAIAPTPALEGPEQVVATLVALAREILSGEGDVRVLGVGVGTAGVVDVTTGSIVSATDTFARWPGTQLAARVREALGDLLPAGAPVHVQNDVDAHAVGEFVHGAARGSSSALVIAVGTGVGGGIILNGTALRGAHHVAGEIAHMPVPGAEHLRCPCGRMGHFEAIGSGIGMHNHFLSLGGSPEITNGQGIVAAARAGDAIAAQALRESAAAVGRGAAAAVTLLDPEAVVITGGVAQIGEDWWGPMETAFRAEVIDALSSVPLLAGRLAGDAPLVGAAASAWNALEEQQ